MERASRLRAAVDLRPIRIALGGVLLAATLLAAPGRAQPGCVPADIVRADAAALSSGRPAELLSLFDEAARVFAAPRDPARLTGELSDRLGTHEQRRATFASFAGEAPDRTQVLDIATVGDLAIAKLGITGARDGRRSFRLVGFRVRNCRIVDLWHIGRADSDDGSPRATGVVDRLVRTNNEGDVEGFLGTFAPDVLNFRNSGDPHAIGDKPSRWNSDPVGRRALFEKMFASGGAAQVRTERVFAVGDLVVSQDVATLPGGRVLDEISIYRIGSGRITHDWLIAEQPRTR